jgi:hypothetical protein
MLNNRTGSDINGKFTMRNEKFSDDMQMTKSNSKISEIAKVSIV